MLSLLTHEETCSIESYQPHTVAKVLHYECRETHAFTYWEKHYPSCIELGEDKYGGPLTVEVKNVKTF